MENCSFDIEARFRHDPQVHKQGGKLSEPIRYSPVLNARQRSHRILKDQASRGSWQSVKIASLLVRN